MSRRLTFASVASLAKAVPRRNPAQAILIPIFSIFSGHLIPISRPTTRDTGGIFPSLPLQARRHRPGARRARALRPVNTETQRFSFKVGAPMVGRDVPGAPRPRGRHRERHRHAGRRGRRPLPSCTMHTMSTHHAHTSCTRHAHAMPAPMHTHHGAHGRARRPRRAAPTGATSGTTSGTTSSARAAVPPSPATPFPISPPCLSPP